MSKEFIEPVIEILCFDNADIVTASRNRLPFMPNNASSGVGSKTLTTIIDVEDIK